MKPQITPARGLPWPIDYDLGVLPLSQDEGCRLRAYKCVAGVWTCGWAETEGVSATTVWTQEYADQRLCDSLHEYTAEVLDACTVRPTAGQLAALVRFAYNIGLGWKGSKRPAGAKDGFRQSSVLRNHNAGKPMAAARSFSLWNKYTDPVTKQQLEHPVLTARRNREAATYLEYSSGAPSEAAPPQSINPESRLTTSPIAQSGVVTAGAGVVGVIGAAGDQLNTVTPVIKTARDFVVDTVGIPADYFLPILLVAVGALVVWQRGRQRSEGWA